MLMRSVFAKWICLFLHCRHFVMHFQIHSQTASQTANCQVLFQKSLASFGELFVAFAPPQCFFLLKIPLGPISAERGGDQIATLS